MASHRRSAEFIETLVYADEPLLIRLASFKTAVIAVAIPSPAGKSMFLGAAVPNKELEAYIEGEVDLLFLFKYSFNRNLYTFDLLTMKDGRVMMSPCDGDAPEEWLPQPRFFSRNHTEESLHSESVDSDTETLLVDGEWDMPDFGEFYSRYADLYYFLAATNAFEDSGVDADRKKRIIDAFADTPFKGGSSYLVFYRTLPRTVSRRERLRMDKIRYESPGYVDVNGDAETFREVAALIRVFLAHKPELKRLYTRLHQDLSKGGYLQMSGESFQADDPQAQYIRDCATGLATGMLMPNLETLEKLVRANWLVYAKLVLSFYRRLDVSSTYFAQGRMAFGEIK